MMRRLWPDRNPLRRAADRAETAVMAGLLAMFLAGVPLAAVAAAGWVAANGMHAERAQARRRQVPAVLLQDAPEPAHALSQASLEPLMRARWTAPGGALRKGEIYAPGGARAGATVMVWTDSAGKLEGAPVRRADVTIWKAFAALAAACACRGRGGDYRAPRQACPGQAPACRLGRRVVTHRPAVDRPGVRNGSSRRGGPR